jgi:multifunctional methyltransferase subunit TRM112
MLMCHVKGCNTNNFPLGFQEVELETIEAEFNEDFMRRLLPKLDWPALVKTAFDVSYFFNLNNKRFEALFDF